MGIDLMTVMGRWKNNIMGCQNFEIEKKGPLLSKLTLIPGYESTWP